jgi:hypothetical protein
MTAGTSVCSRGKKKGKKEGEKPRSGAPREKASSYATGTKRKGLDGAIWEVCMSN